ncbi:hypothetical protein ACFVAJ_10245 [Agromyces sp. NPDC057679]|uniref:hypothetical protein n=1 Tax=Agromyces sp. NPDC057679 TaxID=3346207 RepID=UPI00366D4B16
MSTRRDRNRRLRRRLRPESTRPAVVVVSTILMLVCLGVAIACGWLLVDAVVQQIGPFETVGRARPTPAWFAWIGFALGGACAGQIAFENAAYLVRVIRKTPKLVPVPRDS